MAAFEDLSQLLLLPQGESPLPVEPWLQLAARHLEGFRPHPAVLRHTLAGRQASVEARRWSEAEYRALTTPSQEGERLMLRADGRLALCSLERLRQLRDREQERIYDEIYEFNEVLQPTTDQLLAVQRAVLARLYREGYGSWNRLTPLQRRRLAAHGAGWQEASAALDTVSGQDEVQTLELFLSEEAHPRLREEVLAAGGRGQLRPGTDVLAFLLARPDWNLNPGLVQMARSAASDDPDKAWDLHQHPNPQVRLRLVDLMQDPKRCLEWLAVETEGPVRERLRQFLEQRCTPSQLVDWLLDSSDPNLREALGWVLVHWSKTIDGSQDWGAFNRALRSSLGAENRSRLRRKLAAVGKLSLRARWLP